MHPTIEVLNSQATFGGVVQYDSGKAMLSGFEQTGSLNSLPQMLFAIVVGKQLVATAGISVVRGVATSCRKDSRSAPAKGLRRRR